jgi:reverse gyrase
MTASRYCFVEHIEIMKSLKNKISIQKINLKIARLDGCSLNELPARLNEERKYAHAALSTENGQKGKTRF